MFSILLFVVLVLAILIAVQYVLQEDPDARSTMIPFINSQINGTLETVLFALLLVMAPMLIFSQIWGWPSIAYYATNGYPIGSLMTADIILNIVIRVFLAYAILCMTLFTGIMIINWPHGVARFIGGKKWRSMQPGFHVMLGGIWLGPYLLKIGRNVVVLREEIRASVVLQQEEGMSSEQADATLTTKELPSTYQATAVTADGAVGGARLSFPFNFYYVKYQMFTFLGLSGATTSKHLVGAIKDLIEVELRKLVATVDYDIARFTQGMAFLLSDTNALANELEAIHETQMDPVKVWQRQLQDLRVIERVEAHKRARDYQALVKLLYDSCPNSLAVRILNQFGVLVTFLGIENGKEEQAIVDSRLQQKEAELKMNTEFAVGSAEMQRAIGTVAAGYGKAITDWKTLPDGDELKERIRLEAMQVWEKNRAYANVGAKDKIIVTGGGGQSGIPAVVAGMFATQPVQDAVAETEVPVRPRAGAGRTVWTGRRPPRRRR